MSTPVPAPEIDLDALLTDAVQSMVDDGRGKAILAKASAASAKPFVAKPKYTAAAMVQLMVEHPEYSHTQFAAHFGYQASWFAGVLVSPNLQAALEPRRSEIANPMLTGTEHNSCVPLIPAKESMSVARAASKRHEACFESARVD